MLSVSPIGLIVRLVLRMPRAIVPDLWKIFIDIEVDPILGVGVVMEGLVDSALQSVLLLPLQKIEQRLIVRSSIPVSLACRCAHLTIL